MARVTTGTGHGTIGKPPPKKHPPKPYKFDLPLPGPEYVGIRTVQLYGAGSDYVIGQLAETSPVLTAGGGFEAVNRPLRRGVPRWRGTDTPTLTMALILGDNLNPGSVERDIAALERMAGGMLKRDPEPPHLVINGAMVPHARDVAGHEWVMADAPAWAAGPASIELARDATGRRTRQAVDLTFMLASEDVAIRAIPHAPPPRYRHIKARKGDTFEKIAKRELGDKRLAHKLATLNGRGGGSVSVVLHTGLDVKVPTGPLLAEWRRALGKTK